MQIKMPQVLTGPVSPTSHTTQSYLGQPPHCRIVVDQQRYASGETGQGNGRTGMGWMAMGERQWGQIRSGKSVSSMAVAAVTTKSLPAS